MDPSSTTITWRAYVHPKHASTTAPTVGASLRAGTTTSTIKGALRLRLRTSGQAGPLTPGDHFDSDLARGLVDHLVAEHDGALALALRRQAVGIEDVPRPVELLLVRGEHLVEDRDLVGVEGPLAVVTEDLRALAEASEAVVVAHLDVGA